MKIEDYQKKRKKWQKTTKSIEIKTESCTKLSEEK